MRIIARVVVSGCGRSRRFNRWSVQRSRMLLGAVLLMALSPLRAETLHLVADNWCPFNCSANSSAPGFLVEVAQRALALSGYQVEYQTRPWSRAIADVRQGRFDALVGAGEKDVPDFVFPDAPLAIARHTIYTLPDAHWTYAGEDDLHDIKLGVIDDYSYGELMDRYITPNRRDDTRLLILNGQNILGRFIDMLKLGRIDAFVEEEAVLHYFAERMPTPVHLRDAGVVHREPIYIAFSPALDHSRELARALDNGVRALRQSGALDRLASRYGVTPGTPEMGE